MRRMVLTISVLASLAFWFTEPIRPFVGSELLKWVPIGGLALWAWLEGRSRQRGVVVTALLIHSVGDVLLERDFEALLIPAIASFLVGHLLYLSALWRHRRPWTELPGSRRALLGGLLLFGGCMLWLILPHTEGPLRVAIPLYLAAILAMTASATVARLSTPWALAGALLYVASDSLIAVGVFVRDIGAASLVIWPTYYLGQVLIPLGILRSGGSEDSD